jgi:ADP-dependent phosphofructokinase/glucokinase
MKIEVNIPDPQIDRMVVESLKESYRLNCKPDKIDNSGDVIDVDYALLNAFNTVISYYSTHEEYKEWVDEKSTMLNN